MNLQRCYFRSRLLRSSAVLLVSIILLSGVSISLASSFLDPGFGANGVAITSLEGNSSVSSVAIQTDGQIVGAGSTGGHFALVRYTVTGTLDTAFGSQGIVTTTVGANYESFASMAIQPDGKLVAAGGGSIVDPITHLGNGFVMLARYTTTGTLDPDFGVGGVVTTPLWATGGASAVAIQSDGRIIVAGTVVPPGNFCSPAPFVSRYTITGSLDTEFGANGTVGLSWCGNCSAPSVVVQPDYKIIIAGGPACTYGTGSGQIFLARMNQNGSLDTTFGTGGIVRTSGPSNSDVVAYGAALQTDGKIVVAGTSGLNYNRSFLAARYCVTGTLDSAFGSGGIVTTSVGVGDNHGHSVAVQPDGQIVVGGYSNDGVRNNFGLVRYLSSGVLDPLWGIGGVVTSSVGGSWSLGNSVALQSDGKIVLGGQSSDDGVKSDFAVARYLASIYTHSLYLPIVRKG